MLEEFNDLMDEMDSELTNYSQRRDYEKKLTILKEKYENETDFINEIIYEIDFLNFSIEKGELVPLSGYGDWCYPDINKFDNDYKNYLKQRFNGTSNFILKNMYLIIILNLNLNYGEITSFIDNSLNLLSHYLTTENNIDWGNDLLLITFDKCMSFGYKKEEIVPLIVKYVKAEFYDIFNVKQLIELMLLKKRVFNKDDFEGLDDICWDCAQKSLSFAKIEFLLLGQKISQKIENANYDWYNEIGKTYEDLADMREDSKMVQIIHLSNAIEYYLKGKNPQNVERAAKKLKKAQKDFKPIKMPIEFKVGGAVNAIIAEIYEKIPLSSNKFLEFLIHDKNEFLIPKLKKDDENYKNFIDVAPLLAVMGQLKFDNNHNIIQILNNDEEERIMDSNYVQYHLLFIFQNWFLEEMFIYAYYLKIFTYDLVITYLSNYQKFLSISNDEKPLLYYFKPIIKEYFKQLELVLSNEEYNYVLFIDSIVSKLEFLVRKLCEIYDINLFKPQRNGTTSLRLLHDLFSDSKFKEVLLENDYDFLKFVLLKPGLNLRNKSTHGLDLEIYTFDNANLLLLCFFRLLKYFIIIDENYFQELEFFKYQNFDKISNIIKFGLGISSKIDEYQLYLMFKLLD